MVLDDIHGNSSPDDVPASERLSAIGGESDSSSQQLAAPPTAESLLLQTGGEWGEGAEEEAEK